MSRIGWPWGALSECTNDNVVVTFANCELVAGPFLHGTRAVFEVGDELVPGQESNFQQARRSNHIYFTTVLETAVRGADLAAALSGGGARGRIYQAPTAHATPCASSAK